MEINNNNTTSTLKISKVNNEEKNDEIIQDISDEVWNLCHIPEVILPGIDDEIKSFIGTANWDGTAKIWNIITNELYANLTDHFGRVNCIIPIPKYFFPDAIIATGGNDKTIKFWNIQTKTCIKSIEHHTSYVGCLVHLSQYDNKNFSEIIASGSFDHTVRIINFVTGELISTLNHANTVLCILYLPDIVESKSIIATGGWEYNVQIWDVKSKNKIFSFPQLNQSFIPSLIHLSDYVVSGKNDIIVSSCNGGTLNAWSVSKKEEVFSLKTHTSNCLIYMKGFDKNNSDIFASVGSTNKVYEIFIWKASTEQKIANFKLNTVSVYYSIIYLKVDDQDILITGNAKGNLEILKLKQLESDK